MLKKLIFVLMLTTPSALLAEDYSQYRDELWYQKNAIKNLMVEENVLNFLVVGDWGRNGHFQQKAVASQMDNLMYWLDAEFILSTGDNFYPDGVESVKDPYFQSSFEQIYTYPHLFEPWYLVLGNHDYRGNVQAQIDYSKVSRRWNMPKRYYKIEKQLEDSHQTLLLVLIDTSPFEAKYLTESKYKNVHSQDGQKQLRWLTETLAQSNATWKIVIGHHPMYSSGKRYGKTGSVRAALEPIMEKYGVHAYFAGHEHDLQHNQIAGKNVHHFISGAGSAVRQVKPRAFTKFARATAGVTSVSIHSDFMLVQMVNAQGEVIYHTRINANR